MRGMSAVDIPEYLAFLPEPLLAALATEAEPCPGVPGLLVAKGLQVEFPRLESSAVLGLVVEVYRAVRAELGGVLARRVADRAFVDAGTLACAERNRGRRVDEAGYETVIGARDATGRVIVGPTGEAVEVPPVVQPDFMRGDQVTLFGPPDSARMAINAMNAVHRRPANEAPRLAAMAAINRSGCVMAANGT